MPEIAEVARIVHFVRKHLVGKTLAVVTAAHDDIVYGKVGTSAAEFQKALTGKQMVDAGQQGKYFWFIMSSPPHPVMHFGMAGWLKIKSEETYYYKTKKGDDNEDWPPKYWKFMLETKEKPKVEAAFVDCRRLARIRLVDCEADQIRKVTPLKENGPDPVVDKDLVTEEWLVEKCRAKKVPIKALLLDQANISGIGNWVGDEIMYHAKIHPEQYSNTLSEAQLKTLHGSIHQICDTAVELLADSDRYPQEWLFKHRWGKGKKDASKTLPTGEQIVFLTVGGRTSAVVPSVQRKTGPVAKEVTDGKNGAEEREAETKPKTGGNKRKPQGQDEIDEDTTSVDGFSAKTNGGDPLTSRKGRRSRVKEEGSTEATTNVTPTAAMNKKRKSDTADDGLMGQQERNSKSRPSLKQKKEASTETAGSLRRSARSKGL